MLFQSASSQVDLKPNDKIQTASDEKLEDIENQYPFQTQGKGCDFSINPMPIRVSMKRPAEFEDPHKLSRGQIVAVNRGIDIPYTKNRGSRAKTQGLFATDPQRTSVFKNEGEQTRKGRIELLQRNQRMRDYLDKQTRLEDKKLLNKRNVQKVMDSAIKENMFKDNEKFMKLHTKKIRETFFKDPPSRQNRLKFIVPGED